MMKIMYRLINEPIKNNDTPIWEVVETERDLRNAEMEQAVNASVLLNYLNNFSNSTTLLNIIRERVEFKVGDRFSTTITDHDMIGETYLLNNIAVFNPSTRSEKEILSLETIVVNSSFVKHRGTDHVVFSRVVNSERISIVFSLRDTEEPNTLNLEEMSMREGVISKDQFPESKIFIENYVDNPFLEILLRKKEAEMKELSSEMKKVRFSMVFQITKMDIHLGSVPLPEKIAIYDIRVHDNPEENENLFSLPDEFPTVCMVIDCNTGSVKFALEEPDDEDWEDEDEWEDDEDEWEDDEDGMNDNGCDQCEETSHVLDILCEIANSNSLYLYKRPCECGECDGEMYLSTSEGDLIVSTVPDLIKEKQCKVVQYKKKDISKIVKVAKELDKCKIALVTSDDSYIFSSSAFETFLKTYKA